MDFLLQFQVKADEVFYKDPLEFELKDMDLTLYLDDNVNWISRGKKAHVVVDAPSKEDAYKSILPILAEFNNRLLFLTGDYIGISHVEFIISDQTGEEIREILVRDIKLPGKHELDYGRINYSQSFLTDKINDVDSSAIHYFNQAIMAELPWDKYKALYLALESLAGEETVEARCDNQKCGGVLICRDCQKSKKYPRTTTGKIDDFIKSTNYAKKFDARMLSGRKLAKIRSRLLHVNKSKNIRSQIDLNGYNHKLSSLIRYYLEEKYKLWPGPSVVKSGVVAGDERKYKTENPNEKFALDIPPLDDFINNRQYTRWLI